MAENCDGGMTARFRSAESRNPWRQPIIYPFYHTRLMRMLVLYMGSQATAVDGIELTEVVDPHYSRPSSLCVLHSADHVDPNRSRLLTQPLNTQTSMHNTIICVSQHCMNIWSSYQYMKLWTPK